MPPKFLRWARSKPRRPGTFTIGARFDTSDVLARLNGQARQVPFAISLALNRTAAAVKDAEEREMRDVFDRPTPWTLRGVGSAPSTKSDLRAVVFLKDRSAVSSGHPPDVYLTPEIRGGTRNLKAFELAFRSAGVLPSSMMMVPGSAMTLDAYGNIPTGLIVQLLSYFKAFPEQGYRANVTEARKAKLKRGTKKQQGFEYFALRGAHGKLPPGIYKRVMFAHGSSVKPIIVFVDSAHYEAIYDFGFVGESTVAKQFPIELASATTQALATAR